MRRPLINRVFFLIDPSSSPPVRRFRRLVVAALPLLATFWLFSAFVLVRDFHHSKAYGWTMTVDGESWEFATVDADGPAAGLLEPGDRLLALNGDTRAATLGYLFFSNAPVGERYRVDIDRRGERKAFDILMPVGPGRQLWLVFLTVSFAFFVCGAGLGLVRPQDPQVRLIAVLLIAASCTTLHEVLGSVRTFLVGWERSVHLLSAALALFTFPMTFQFFARFPEWRRPGPVTLAVQYALYASMAVVFLPAWIVYFMALDVGERASRFLVDHPSLFFLAYRIQVRSLFVFVTGSLALAILVAVRNYASLRDPGSRRRVRWVVFGLVVGCAPYIVVIVLYRVFAAISDETYRFWYPATFVTMLAIPAAIVMAVWKEQLFDVRVIVRRGLQYLFARTALQGLLALPVALLLFSIFRNPNRTVVQILTQGSGSVLHPTLVQVLYRAEERSNRFEGHSSSGPLAILQLPPGADALPDDERSRFEALGVRLIVTISGTRERLVGVLLLGDRLSDQPYSPMDRQLLHGIAAQIGLVYENEQLRSGSARTRTSDAMCSRGSKTAESAC
jgi:hypothetical protein